MWPGRNRGGSPSRVAAWARAFRLSGNRGAPGAGRAAAGLWRVKAEGIELSGQERGLKADGDVAWPQQGRISLQGRGLGPGLSAFGKSRRARRGPRGGGVVAGEGGGH